MVTISIYAPLNYHRYIFFLEHAGELHIIFIKNRMYKGCKGRRVPKQRHSHMALDSSFL
jgi:hypothetical protein